MQRKRTKYVHNNNQTKTGTGLAYEYDIQMIKYFKKTCPNSQNSRAVGENFAKINKFGPTMSDLF